MEIRRVALIFDRVQRPETTGVYCLRALQRLVEVEHFQPADLERVPRSGFDLYLNIDDGLRYHLPQALRPSALWAIDTHMDMPWAVQKASGFDLVFAAQRDGAEGLRRHGIASAAWLPLACDHEIHGRHEVPKEYDVAFVGNVFPGVRAELLALIRRRYSRSFIGQCYFEEMARAYSAARIAFNRSIKNDVNMRVFEALASGSMLLTNDLRDNGMAELFRDGVHLGTYGGPEDMLDKLAFYLERDALREKIAAAGRAEVLEKHTYCHRMEHVLREAARTFSGATAQTHPNLRPEAPLDSGTVKGATAGAGAQDRSYFAHARPEVMALVPETARYVVDVGCGAGRLGEAIKARQNAHVVGIELDPGAASEARRRLDEVFEGDVERLELPFPTDAFDAVICGDILEHVRDPYRILRQARTWLSAGGCLVASIPNVRHHSVVRSLLAGNWTYESAGLLDQTHLRFFTRREIEKLFFRAGFSVEEMRSVVGPGDHEAVRNGTDSVNLGRLRLGGLPRPEITEFLTYQYLVRARPAALPDRGLTSIVIVTHNQLEYTRQCLDSIRPMTDEPYELIVVDNGSTDGTVEYLQGFADVRPILNRFNCGFPAAVNQGMAVATGRQILLLNNDVIVTTGWLCRLLRALERDPSIGLAGPCSNFVSGPQQVAVDYEALSDLDGFAWDWGGANDGRIIDVNRLVGFCLLVRRAVIDKIGVLDEQFGVGCFEDDDYCLRAIHAGFRCVIAADAFIHHFGGRTFVGSGADAAAIMRHNQQRFQEKWSRNGHSSGAEAVPAKVTSGPEIASRFAVEMAPGGGLLLKRKMDRPRLSLCMIVRDNARTLPACLESIRPWVDEMVIVDTGSRDETPRIVESYGGRLFHFPWPDSFSIARNESLKHAQGDWLFWMDSDDTILPECGRKLRRLAYSETPAEILGYIMQVHCPAYDDDGVPIADATVVDHVKLFRNRPDLRFDGRIHEQVLPAIRSAGGQVAWTDIFVIHSGSDQSPAAQDVKRARDLRLLNLELAERPEHPFTLFNLGMTHVHGSQFEEAVDFLRRGIKQSGRDEPHVRKAYALLVYAQMRLGRHDQALADCREGRAMFPHDTELRFREGVLLQEMGRLEESRQAYFDVLNGPRDDRHFASVDLGLKGFKARQNLAVLAADMGDFVEAERQWREVVREVPSYRQGWRGLADTMTRAGRVYESESLANELIQHPELCLEGYLIKSRAAMRLGRIGDARHLLEKAVTESPTDAETERAHCQFVFEHGTWAEAEEAIRNAISRNPTDASAHHNWGTLMMKAERYQDAAQAYQRSIELRPNHSMTYLNLGYALKGIGQIEQAQAAWLHAARLAPNDATARDELRQLSFLPSPVKR